MNKAMLYFSEKKRESIFRELIGISSQEFEAMSSYPKLAGTAVFVLIPL